MPEYECDCRLMVTAEHEADAYTQFSDSGVSAGALIGSVLILSVDPIEDVNADD